MTRAHPVPGGVASTAPGTAEDDWRPWLGERPWPLLPSPPDWRSALVCAAHPDDDVLAIGGLLVLLSTAGRRLHLLAATDGEGSHPGSSVVGPAALGRRRVAETHDALAVLGITAARHTRLGLPDAGLAACEAELTDAVTRALGDADVVLAPWPGDGHPDHEALGRAAVAAGAAAGLPVLTFPVWMWHWAAPDDPRVPWGRLRRLPLPPDARARKRRAVGCFASQVRRLGTAPEDAVVLPPEVLAHFDRDAEWVIA
jgi:LmbE family N-acetylglucosaminyl deacetylase